MRWLFCGTFLLCAYATRAQTAPPELPEANPARPTVANPATLTPVGYLQFENGLLAGWQSPGFSSRVGFEQLTKLTVHPRLQLLLQSEPVVGAWSNPGHSTSVGGVAAGVQGVLFPGHDARPTIALAYLGAVYNGPAPDIDIGSFQHSLTLLVSLDVAGFHADINGLVNEQQSGAVRRAQYGQTISVSRQLVGKWGIGGELWHFTQPFLKSNTVGTLWSVSYTPRRNLVLDTGFNYGFNATSTRWSYFAGFTYLLPHRLWPARGPQSH